MIVWMKINRFGVLILLFLTSCTMGELTMKSTLATPSHTILSSWTTTITIDNSYPTPINPLTSLLPSTKTIITTPTLYGATANPSDQRILFLKDDRCTVMSVSISGGGDNTDTITPIDDCYQGEISPDGRQIAYIGKQDNSAIYLANINGSNVISLGNIPLYEGNTPVSAREVEWSPNGKKLAILTDYPPMTSGADLYILATDGSKKINNIFLGPISYGVLWSPDSKWIFYVAEIGHHGSLTLYPLAYRLSDSHTNIIDFIYSCYPECINYEWSHDSKSISFVPWFNPKGGPECVQEECDEMRQQSVVIATLTNTEDAFQEYIPLPRQELSENEVAAWDPTIGVRWSPDLMTLLIMQRFTRTITILQRDGTIKNIVISFPDNPLDVDWSPDGKWIYFLLPGSGLINNGRLGIIRPDGSDLRFLANDVAVDSIVWTAQ